MYQRRRAVRQHLRGAQFNVLEFDWWDDWSPEEITQRCNEAMQNCIAAVHFIDTSPGPSGAASSGGPYPLQLQLSAAEERMQRGDVFFQLSWVGPKSEIGALPINNHYWQRLQPAIRAANTDPVDQFSRDVLLHILTKATAPAKGDEDEEYIRTVGKPVACIVYNNNDLRLAEKLKAYLEDRQWKVHLPEPFGVKEHFSKRRTFVFYWGSGDDRWCQGNFKELQQRRTQRFTVDSPWGVAVYLGREENLFKTDAKENASGIPGYPQGWFCRADGDFSDFNPDNIPDRFEEFARIVEGIAWIRHSEWQSQ
jgi:hypothetical protein